MFDGALTQEEIMDKLEERVGPEGRKLFERFLRAYGDTRLCLRLQLPLRPQLVHITSASREVSAGIFRRRGGAGEGYSTGSR